MRITYDPQADALSIVFQETASTSKPLGDGIAADYDREGRLTAIEVRQATRKCADPSTLKQIVVEGLGPGAFLCREVPKPAGP